MDFNAENQVWRRCEVAWMAHLAADRWLVTRLADAANNFEDSGAPLMQVGGRLLRAPDLQVTRDGRTEFWEVKYRSRADLDPLTGQSEYWVTSDSLNDYLEIGRVSGAPVNVILHDSQVWKNSQKWLTCDIETIRANGRNDRRHQADGQEVDAWVWPSSIMTLTNGPSVEVVPPRANPILQPVNDEEPYSDEIVTMAERVLRRKPKAPESIDEREGLPPGVFDVLRSDCRIRLDALRRSLGITDLPLYSVMRLGVEGVNLDDLLSLMRYGIRVFLVSEMRPELDEWMEACISARLFEWAEASVPNQLQGWVVDGELADEHRKFLSPIHNGNFNFGQFVIVHENPHSDILVSAGAGSGKTETMSERIVFLLATSRKHLDPRDQEKPLDLDLGDIALITFTREAASEMRSRIARTILLRQRLCDLCVLPTTAWILAMSRMEVDTIHTYSKKIIQRDGIVIGLGPSYKVSSQTMDFRRLIEEELSIHIGDLITSNKSEDIPPFHELREQVERLWGKLSGTGFSPLAVASGAVPKIDWGTPADGLVGDVTDGLKNVVYEVARKMLDLCSRNQTIPVDELVQSASRVVGEIGTKLRHSPRFLFVDEFQDTDSEQIGMITSIRNKCNARIFVVGDQKQGVYRFRGAEGNAFGQLETSAMKQGFSLTNFELKLNFRSSAKLLDSMHPYFDSWGQKKFLPYGQQDRLIATTSGGDSLAIKPVQARAVDQNLVEQIADWLQEIDQRPKLKIGILCRRNKQAFQARELLREAGIPCEIKVGGDFYRSPVVIELRVLLEAALDPSDDIALLELSESRWFPGICAASPPDFLTQEEKAEWEATKTTFVSWKDRFSSLGDHDSFRRDDLDSFRFRVVVLGRRLQNLSAMAWLIECKRLYKPELVAYPDPTDQVERSRYARGFDHLVTKLDEEFSDAPLSPHLMLEHLRLKIATDRSEDEPSEDPSASASVTALTVHKSKGLEYDFVLVPFTNDYFFAGSKDTDESVVVVKGAPRFIWKWKSGSNNVFTNVDVSDSAVWSLENKEKVKEETRLLYVAMTRAREKLVIFTSATQPGQPPSKWNDLLRMVES